MFIKEEITLFELSLSIVLICFLLSNALCYSEKNTSKRLFLNLLFFIQLLYIYGSVLIVFSNYNGTLSHKYFDLQVNDESLFLLVMYIFFSFLILLISKFLISNIIDSTSILNYKINSLSSLVKYLIVLSLFVGVFSAELIDEFRFYISEKENSGIYNFFRLAIISLTGAMLMFNMNERYTKYIYILILLAFSVVIKEKDPLFFILIFIVVRGLIFLPKLAGQVFIYLIVVVVLFGSKFFSLIRGGHDFNNELFSKVFFTTSIESFDSFGPLMASLFIQSRNIQFDDTLFIYTSTLIPQFFFKLFDAERGLDLGQVFAKTIISNWQPGMGIGMSPLSEMSIYGILAGGFLYVFCFYLLVKYFSIVFRLLGLNSNAKSVFILSLFPYLALLYLRGYSVLIFKVYPVVIIITFLLFKFAVRGKNE